MPSNRFRICTWCGKPVSADDWVRNTLTTPEEIQHRWCYEKYQEWYIEELSNE